MKYTLSLVLLTLFSFTCAELGYAALNDGISDENTSKNEVSELMESTLERPSIILISIDGFRPDYLERVDTPNLDRLVKVGVLAEGLIPVFPTKTFPNHYSLVTGLYTENTGIIANTMYDETMQQRFSLGNRAAVSDGRWYGGEPIWVTAENNGIRTATMFWPGSEAEIKGVRPTRYYDYDDDLNNYTRVDSVLSWMALEDDTRPDFMTLYFSTVDTYGHRYGPDSDSVYAAVAMIDGIIGNLVDRLEQASYWSQTNLILTSDHGMYELSEEKVFFLDDFVSLSDITVVDWTPVSMIRVDEDKLESVYKQLKAAENDYPVKVYLKEDVPDVYRFKNNPRVPEIIIIPELGWSITSKDFFENRGVRGGAHGWDPRYPDMHAFFLAVGPDFAEGKVVEPFELVHIYEMMCHLLGIEPAKNDGNLDSVMHLLREGN